MAESAAGLAALFGYEVPEEEGETETAPEKPEATKPEEKSGEGEGEPSGVAAPETPAGEGPTAEPQTEISETETPDERYERLLSQLGRYQRFEPILEALEQNPALARRVLAEHMGLVEPAPAHEESKPTTPAGLTPEQQEQVKSYWERRMAEDPLGGLAEFIDRLVEERMTMRLAPTERITAKSLVRDFKSELKSSDPTFVLREAIFDQMAAQADPSVLKTNPDQALQALDILAMGVWAKQQRAKAADAKGRAKPATREAPRTLTIPTETSPAGEGTKPKPKRTPEEEYLAAIYGDELLEEGEESESAWGS